MPERRKGTYAACRYTPTSISQIETWAKTNKIPNVVKSADFHSTIIYSRVELKKEFWLTKTRDELSNVRFKPIEVKVLTSRDGKNAIILVLDAPELHQYHQELLACGATHDFPSLLAHVTISYDVPDDFDASLISPPDIYLVPSEVYTEPLDCDWKE